MDDRQRTLRLPEGGRSGTLSGGARQYSGGPVKPIEVSVAVDRPIEEVYAFLDEMANHERFTDHMLVDWSYSGPPRGVGSKARMRADLPGPKDWTEITVIDAAPPARIVEQGVSAGGKRRTQGTYTLSPRGDAGTTVRFELRYLETPSLDRVLSPMLSRWLERGNARAMERLGELLR